MPITETDIANRALQRVGAGRIAAGALRTEDSKNAHEIVACYDILRRAELRRNVWRFATRRAALRSISSDSKVVAFPVWSSVTTYAVNGIVLYNGVIYFSKVGSNLNNTPDAGFDNWALYFGPDIANLHTVGISYFAGELVYDGSNDVYLSLISGNEDTPPTSNWLLIDNSTLSDLNFIYPIGAGPVSESESQNVLVLPVGFLRQAPEGSKTGSTSSLGAPSTLAYRDWIWEGNYIVTQDVGVSVLRFVADLADPNEFDALFVEGIGSRIALEICEPLTQSGSKLGAIASEYKQFMFDARMVNAIEKGPDEAPTDDYLSVRT